MDAAVVQKPRCLGVWGHHRCRGNRGALLPVMELLNLSQQQPVSGPPGAAGPKLLLQRATQQAAAPAAASADDAPPPDQAPAAPAEQQNGAATLTAAPEQAPPAAHRPSSSDGQWRESAPPQSLPMPSATLGFGRVKPLFPTTPTVGSCSSPSWIILVDKPACVPTPTGVAKMQWECGLPKVHEAFTAEL